MVNYLSNISRSKRHFGRKVMNALIRSVIKLRNLNKIPSRVRQGCEGIFEARKLTRFRSLVSIYGRKYFAAKNSKTLGLWAGAALCFHFASLWKRSRKSTSPRVKFLFICNGIQDMFDLILFSLILAWRSFTYQFAFSFQLSSVWGNTMPSLPSIRIRCSAVNILLTLFIHSEWIRALNEMLQGFDTNAIF